MTFYWITSLICTIIIRKITAITNEVDVNPLSEHGIYDNGNSMSIPSDEMEEIKFDDEFDNVTESRTSQDRISYYSKRGAPYPHRFSHHHHFPHHHHHHPHHHYHRLPYHRPPRKKHRNSRKKPSMHRTPYTKSLNKRQKPILLSEVLRNGARFPPYSKIKPPGPIIKDYIEEDDLETSPFSPVDTIETYPSFGKFTRPQSFEITDDSPDVLPVQPIEEEIIIPGTSNSKPFSAIIKRPQSIFSISKPTETYYDSDTQDNIRNVRFANKPSYLDKDVMNLLQKIKLEGQNADNAASSTETIAQVQKDNVTDLNIAISKLLFPFLSETAIKQIQLYFKSLPSSKQHKEDDKNNVEHQLNEYLRNVTQDSSHTQSAPTKQYSVTESIKEDDGDNTTYFIMVKSPNYKGLNITKLLSNQLQQQKSYNVTQTEPQKPEKSTTPPTEDTEALQKYIMMLAGISKDPANSDNYLPRFNNFQKRARNL